MSDDKSNLRESDRNKVSESQGYEVEHYAKHYGITHEEARQLIREHGNSRKELEAAAGRLKSARGK